MRNQDTLATQLESVIAAIVTSLEESGAETIDPASVAIDVDEMIDPQNSSPELKTYASILEIRNHCRRYLGKRHDPTERAKRHINSGTADMFSGQLQDYYPVKRPDVNGEIASIYAKLETLTSDEAQFAAARMRKAGESLIEHARALAAWDKTRIFQAVS